MRRSEAAATGEIRASGRKALGGPGTAGEHLRGGVDATEDALWRHVQRARDANEREAVVAHGDEADDGAGVNQLAPNPNRAFLELN